MSMSSAMDESDHATKRECCICLYDLYLSAVTCSCSPNRYSCLCHVKQLCSCGWRTKQFLFRYEITELDLLVAALAGNLKAIQSWANRKHCLDAAKRKQKNPNAISSSQLNGTATSKNLRPALDLANGENMKMGSSGSARKKHVMPTFGGDANEEHRATAWASPPPITSLQNAVHQSASNSGKNISEISPDHNVVVLLSDDED